MKANYLLIIIIMLRERHIHMTVSVLQTKNNHFVFSSSNLSFLV